MKEDSWNFGTAIVLAILAVACFFAVRSLVRKKKTTGSAFSCGGSCSGCPYAGECGKKDARA